MRVPLRVPLRVLLKVPLKALKIEHSLSRVERGMIRGSLRSRDGYGVHRDLPRVMMEVGRGLRGAY